MVKVWVYAIVSTLFLIKIKCYVLLIKCITIYICSVIITQNIPIHGFFRNIIQSAFIIHVIVFCRIVGAYKII